MPPDLGYVGLGLGRASRAYHNTPQLLLCSIPMPPDTGYVGLGLELGLGLGRARAYHITPQLLLCSIPMPPDSGYVGLGLGAGRLLVCLLCSCWCGACIASSPGLPLWREMSRKC